jgi:hypothetical protein
MDLSRARCLVFDIGGLGIEHACRLGKDFGKVWYAMPWQDPVLSFSKAAPGLGVEGVELVYHPYKYIDKADLICFFDIGFGDLAQHLFEHGHRVYGAKMGESFEEKRYDFRKIQRKLGLPTQKTELIIGTSNLLARLHQLRDVFVKIDIFRGDRESFGHKAGDLSDEIVREFEYTFGPFKDEAEFIIEYKIDSQVEIGVDSFFSKGFIKPCLFGYEKGTPYIGKYSFDLPKQLKKTMDHLTPLLNKVDYRGALSTEEFITGPDDSYIIDMTCRYPYPLSYIMTESIDNYSEFIYSIADGSPIMPEITHTYVACADIEVGKSDKQWPRIDFPKEVRNKIKMHHFCKHDGKYYAVKGVETSICCIGLGESVDAACNMVKDVMDTVTVDGGKRDSIKVLDEIKEEIEKGESFGVEF